MKYSLTIIFTMLMILGLSNRAAGQERAHSSDRRPTYFYPDDSNRGFEHTLLPSDAILSALMQQDDVREVFEELDQKERLNVKHLFEVVQIDLDNANEQNYVVRGDSPMSDGDCVWFWIVRVQNGKAEVMLYFRGLSIKLRDYRSHSYRDVVCHWGVGDRWGDRIYRYDGSTYKLIHEHSHEG